MNSVDDSIDQDWENLLSWLETFDSDIRKNMCVYSKIIPGAGRGLFVDRDVPPNTPLFSVPSAAYLNSSTLSKLYGSEANNALSATQLITLHLYIHRPDPDTGITSDPTYGPYLAILPRDFTSHPLSWLILNTYPTLLYHTPPAAQINLQKVADRLRQDWKAVSEYLESLLQNSAATIPFSYNSWRRTARQGAEMERYLWAWLNVNTRCFYMQLYSLKSDPNNIALCPLVDLANHSSLDSEHQSIDKTPLPTFYSPSKRSLRKDDQVYLKYGPHSNLILFTEYGFIEQNRSDGSQVDVQDIIEARFKNLGDLGDWMKSLLKNVNFWGDWVLYDFPPPASPSYRILPALRLLQLSESLPPEIISVQDPFALSKELKTWRDMVYGEKEIISQLNEDAVWHCLSSICDQVRKRASEGLEALKTSDIEENDIPEWHGYAMECIRHLWLEEVQVAEAVAQSIKSGEV